jgi:hypothetical protein
VTIIHQNEEIITIRSVLDGEYTVNVHYFSNHGVPIDQPIPLRLMIQDVKSKKIIYYGEKIIQKIHEELPYVKFTVNRIDDKRYEVDRVFDDRPEFFIHRTAEERYRDRPGPPGPDDMPHMDGE